MKKYIVQEVYFKNGKPTEVDGKIIHVEKIMGMQSPRADYVAICLIEVEGK